MVIKTNYNKILLQMVTQNWENWEVTFESLGESTKFLQDRVYKGLSRVHI